jgi:hypothetical protein
VAFVVDAGSEPALASSGVVLVSSSADPADASAPLAP